MEQASISFYRSLGSEIRFSTPTPCYTHGHTQGGRNFFVLVGGGGRGRRTFFLFREEAVGCKEAGVRIKRPRPNQRVRKTRSVFSTVYLFSIITFLT